jgi:hypothetical protein
MTDSTRLATYKGEIGKHLTSKERTQHTKARQKRRLARLRSEAAAARDLAVALDRFYNKLAFTAPECFVDRIDELGCSIGSAMKTLGYPKNGKPGPVDTVEKED